MERSEKLEKQLKKVEVEKQKLREIKYQENKRKRKSRDTALYTLGAIFAHYHESSDPEDKEFAANLWRAHFQKVAPEIARDRRKEALKEIFGLDVPESYASNVDNMEQKITGKNSFYAGKASQEIDNTNKDNQK